MPNPSQNGIYKGLIKTGQKLKTKYKNSLNQKDWSLHFHGKIIQHKNYQITVLINANEEIKLSVLELKNGNRETICDVVKKVINEFDLWKSIKMIVTDRTAVNTGVRNGAVSLL